jgi:hypothetical protein
MGASDRGIKRSAGTDRSALAPLPDRTIDKPAASGPGGTKILLGVLVGLMMGGAAGFFLASNQFNDQLVAITQASDIRVGAANQRIAELQWQQLEFARQVDQQQQEIVAQADEQQRKIVRQVSEQERSLLAQQRTLAEQAKQRERDLAKPDLPVKVWVRKSLVGRALVAQLHNFGTQELVLAVTSPASAAGQPNVWHTIIAANATQVIGQDPGWSLVPGDELALEADGFRPMAFTVRANPKTPKKAL